MQGLPEPLVRSPQVQLALRAIKATCAPPVQKAPVTLQILQSWLKLLKTDPDNLLWTAVFTLAFFAGLRGAEYTAQGTKGTQGYPTLARLSFSTLDNEPVVYYTVPSSKTSVHGFRVPLACTKHWLCPYYAIVRYINFRSTHGPLPKEAPLFALPNDSHITKAQVDAKLKHLCSLTGLNASNYSTHSILAGAASTAAELGFADWEIMRLGGWKSSAYRAYIRKLDKHVSNFPARLVSSAGRTQPE